MRAASSISWLMSSEGPAAPWSELRLRDINLGSRAQAVCDQQHGRVRGCVPGRVSRWQCFSALCINSSTRSPPPPPRSVSRTLCEVQPGPNPASPERQGPMMLTYPSISITLKTGSPSTSPSMLRSHPLHCGITVSGLSPGQEGQRQSQK